MIVYLVRHGLSAANVARRVTGTPADGLTDAGRRQAQDLGHWVREAGIRPDLFLVSHWQRARETANLIFPEAEWLEERRLGETDAGSVADLPLDGFLASWPDFYASPANKYPEGESHLALDERVQALWADLCARQAQSLFIVTHSGPISCVLQHVLGIGMDRFPAFLPTHASVSVLEAGAGPDGEVGYFRLKAFSLGPLPGIASAVNAS